MVVAVTTDDRMTVIAQDRARVHRVTETSNNFPERVHQSLPLREIEPDDVVIQQRFGAPVERA